MPNILENLHRNLTADGYQLGSLDDFKKAMADSTKAANLYRNLSSDGYQLGSQEEFFKNVGNTSLQKPAQPAQQKPTSVQTVAQSRPQQPKPQPLQLPQGFGQFDLKQAQRMQAGMGYNPWKDPNPDEVVSAHSGNGKPKPKETVNTQLDKDLKSGKQTASMKQVQDQLEYHQMTGKQLGDGRVKNIAWEAPTLARNENGEMQYDQNGNPLVGFTTEQERVVRYQQDLKDRERNAIVKSAVDKLQQKMEADALAKYGEAQKDNGLTPEFASGDAFGGYIQYLKDSSPEELLKRLNQAYGYEDAEDRDAKDEELRNQGKSTVLAHWDDNNKQMDFANRFLEDNREAIEQTAERVGMSVDDFVFDELVPQLAGDIAQRYQSNMNEKYSVKDTADYLARMMGNSMIGTLATMGATTKKTRQFLQEELQKSREGKGAHYNSNMATNLLGETMMFAADAAPLMVGGALGGLTSKAVGAGLKQLGWSELGALVSSSSPFLAANVGRAMKYGGLALGSMARGIGSMAPFMAASGVVQDLSTGDGTLASIGRAALDGAWEGTKFGAVTGAFGVGSSAMRSGMSRGWKMAQAPAAFLLENQIFAGLDYIKDPENFNWAESTEDAFYMQLASKFSSAHGIKGVLNEFKEIFSPASKKGVRLSNTDKESIQRAFGGMDFVDIASDVNNIGKILSDKQNIPWTTRMKVAAQTMNTCESSRPRTARIKINGYDKTISEIAQNGDLIEVHKYDNADDLLQTRVAIEDRRKNDDMLADFAKLDMQEKAKPILEGFAQEFGMTNEELWKIMQKKPIERVGDEQDLMDELAKRLHAEAYPKGEKHTEQSAIDGADLAGDSAEMNPDTAAAIGQEVAETKEAYENFPLSEDLRTAVYSLGDARLDDIYMYVRNNFSGPEVDDYLKVIADYANAQAKQQGYIEKTGSNIDEQVAQDVDEKSFHGTIDSVPDDGNIITFIKDGEEFVLLNGNVGTRDGVAVDPDKSGGMIIARTKDGGWVSMAPDALMTISSKEPKEAYADRVREQLQILDTQTAIETGLVQPEAPKAEGPGPKERNKDMPEGVYEGEGKESGILDNAGGEAVVNNDNGANNPPATALSRIPTLKDEQGQPVLDEDGDPQYQWDKAPLNDTLTALVEINGGNRETVTTTVDAMLSQAQKELESAEKLTPKGKDPIKIARSAAEIKAQQEEARRKLEYWTAAKQELEKANKPETNLNVGPVENNESEKVVDLQPQAASGQQETEKKPSLKSRLQQLAERYKKKFGAFFDDNIDSPADATELVALNMGTGRQFRWEDKPDGTRGFKTALGIETEFGGRRGSEGHAFAHLFKGKDDTTGMGFDEFVDKVWRSDENTIQGPDGQDYKRFDERQIGDSIIDLFMSAESGKDITEYIIRNRVEKAKKSWEAEQQRLKELAEQNEKIELTDEDVAKIKAELPFVQSTDEEIPDSPITRLDKEAKALMEEAGTPEIKVVDTDRVSDETWRKYAEKAYEGAFIGDEEVEQVKRELSDGFVLYDEGKIIVFSGKLTPEELRENVELIKEHIKDDRSSEQERGEGKILLDEGSPADDKGQNEGEGGPETGENRPGEGSPKPNEGTVDDYLKPRNEKEEKIVSDIEQKLAEEIKAAEDEVRKAKSELEKARTKESDKATDMFANDKAFEAEDQIFSSGEMGLDTTAEGVEKRTKSERDTLAAAEQELERLKSQAEHDSRVRGALDNERRQTSFEEIDERHKREYDEYIKPLLGRSDEELQQLKKAKEDAVGGDMKKLEGDPEYSAINLVLLQRKLDREHEDVKVFIQNTIDDGDVSFVDKATVKEFDELNHLINEYGVDDSEGKIEAYVNRLRKKYPKSDAANPDPIEVIEETATEFREERKEEQKQLGITTDETPQQIADRERAEKLADTPLTDEEVESSSASDVQKTLAKAYLNGNHGILQEAAYLNVYNNVRNRRQDNEENRSDAGSGAQLASSNDNGERRLERVGSQAGDVDTRADVSLQGGERPESGGVQRLEDSENNVPGSNGKRGDNSVSRQESSVGGVHSGSGQPEGSSLAGGRGHHVEQRPGNSRQGNGLAEQSGPREETGHGKPAAGSDAAIAASKQRLAELRKKFRDAGRNGNLSVSLVGMNSEQIGVLGEIITESANLGYQYIHRGMRDFNEWRKQMLADFKDWLQEDFKWTDADVEEYLREVWNCEYNIDGVTRTIGEWASFMGENELKKVVKADRGSKFEQQKAAENVETKVGDIGNIRESLPFLLPEQQDDVYKAETQFFDEAHQDREHGYGKGMMFTNGTGTGKTYTGLGIVKRFVKQGKGRVLILTPSQEKVTDWANDGLNLGLKIEKLDDIAKETGTTATKSKGKGVVVTTYANARQNLAMLEDCFDLIVYDESHKITEGKEAAEGEMFKFHQMLTNKDVEKSMDRQTYWLPEWIEYRNLLKEREENRKTLDMLGKMGELSKEQEELQTRLNARMPEIEKRFEELRPIMQEIRESKRPQAEIDSKRTKTVFLSATPFNRRENLKYAEGYLFSFPEEDKNTIGSYNHRSPGDAFLEQMFPAGYRWRYGRLESHVSNAEALGRQEIDFSDYLQNTLQTMSGRMIASDYDYSRDFPVMTLDHAGRFNQAMSEVYRNKRYNALAEAFRKSFDYNYSTALFEAMKTSLVNDRIKEHLARGQKVVVFHRRRTSGDLEPPFRRALDLAELMASQEQDGNRKSEIKSAIAAFEHDFADMLKWEQTIDYSLPREQIEKRFGKDKVAFFSGAETKKTKHQSVEDFMKDNGGKDIIVIQEASGKEGISLHDQTGEHQRVEINLALPQSPIAFIQIEGRIYRIGQKSNAIFEYPLLGLDLETNLFAQKFNEALGTTENLALGSKARNLRKSIANSVLENTGEVDYERQGYGGKDMDGRVDESGDKDGFDMSIQDYYGNQKMSRGRDNREGVDYFPTPEPIGYKMVEWGQMMDGETALEPSAGHGAIARYVPETNAMTAIEPSASLFTKLQMRAGGPGRRFEEMTFEDYPLANKHDAILMNPPYGVGGKTAMEHVAKAFRHLNEGGRIVAIIPDGPAMEKRLDAWLNSKTYGGTQGVDGAAVVVGEVKLPDVAFGRAGTNVRTRVVVIDKVTRAEMRKNMPQKVTVDLSGEESIGGLFDRIRNVRMPERTIDQAAINEKRAKRTEKQLNDNPFVTGVFMGDMGRNGKFMSINTKAGGTTLDIRLSLERLNESDILDKYASLKKYRDNPEELDYGKWSNRSFGAGKNKVPALDAIRDYCETAIKTLENVSKMTADQMDKRLKEIQAEAERRRAEREVEMQRAIDERKQKQEAKIKEVTDVALAENKDNEVLSPDGIRLNMKIAHGNLYVMAERAKRALTNAGIDWQTGHKIDKNEPVNARTSTVIDERKERWQGDANKPRKQDYEYALDKNTRTGEDMHLVKFNGARLSSEDYKAVERKAKAHNGYYNRFKKAWHFSTEEDARKFVESMNTPSDMSEGPVRFSEVKDKDTIEKLEKSPKIKVYRAMQMIAGKLYPPMAAKRDGKLVDPIELGKWEKADEHPELADENGKFKLDKGNGKSLKAAYNPYIHTSTTMLNDQFSEAQSRDNLVVVECEVPESELTSGYKAEKAKDAVGKLDWKAGVIQGQLSGTREVILSRYDKPVRIVPDKEVAQHISDMIKDKVEVMPTNVVTPQQRAELEKLGVEFVETDNQGRIMYGEHEGETYSSVYGKKNSTVRFSEKKDEEKLNNLGERAESEKKNVSLPQNNVKYEEGDRERVFAGNEAVMRTVAEASDSGVRDSSTEEAGRGSGSKESLLRDVVRRAKESKTWVEDIKSELADNYIGEGQENEVFLSKDGKSVIKVNNFKFVPEDASDLSAFVDRLRAHNELFPADAMELIGFTENSRGEVSAIIRQPYVDAEREATDAEIDKYLEDRDFTVDMTDEWSDGKYGILDLKPSNVLVDKNGRLRFIDVVVRDMDRQKSRTRFKEDEEPLHRQHEANVLKRAEKLSKKLGVPVKVATSVDEVTNREASEAIRAGRKIQGWYDTETGEITLYLPNIENSYEGEKVVAHETIGHKGLRALLGEKGYKSYCKSLLYDLKNPELEKYWMENLAKNGFDTYRTIEEFLAEAAEKGYGDLPMWQKVKESMTDALRRAGFTMSPSISDVKYMVWLSKHNLEKGNIMNQVEREALLYKLGKERYEAKVRNGEYGYDLPSEGESSAPYFPGSGETLFRHTPSVKNQRRNYERSLKRIGYVWKEAHIDAMQSAVELMRSISGVKKIEDIPSAENFVLLENQMSSKEEQMDFLFNRDYMEPLDDAVSKCLPDMGRDIDQQLRNLQLYMIKKHGLERNRVLFIRDALRDIRITDKAKADQLEQDYNDFIRDERDELRNGNIDLREYHQDVDDWIKKNIDPSYTPGEKDYSGLTSLYGKGYNEMDVIDEVMSTESMLGDERVKNLWDKTNAVSQYGLDMEYEGGLDSKEKHDKVSDMFEWYVPLRGYDEKTAEEVYDYLEEGGSSRKWAGPVLMNAKGHEHLSDVDVFATLGAMSSSAINRSLRNQMKQAFARFVRDHYNDVDADSRLVTELPYLWAEKQYDPVTGQDVWVEKFPDIPEGAKADDIAAILDQYQQDMQAKESKGDAKRVRQNSNIPFRPAKPENKAQHIVDVWINGEKHSFVVNGNPRAAQAINGQLKAERNSNILWLSSLSHFMAKMNTSYSPDFIMRNTERDLIYSAANIAVKENAEYWFKWAKNYGVATGRVAAGVPGLHTNLFKRYRDGNLDMSNPTDRYFKEFMENGGETGWVERKNLDKWKETIKKGVKKDSKLEQVGKAVINALPDVIEAMNERAENMARFATYMTSRQMGRTITRSVSDAKEVSVNFNRKGAGKKTVGLNKGDNSWLSNANAYMAGWSAQNLQDYIMFYNAGVQGMTNMIKNVVNHPIKGSTAFAAFALAGLLMPKINQFLFEEDDDKKGKIPENPYAELPEYVRRNNLCIYADNGNFVTIALPIELRAMYGIGDMAASYISNPELRSTKNMGEDIVTQLSQIAPLDFFGEGAGPLWAIVPSGVRPFAEAASNKNWLGQPIERDEERWNKNKPRWNRAFKNVGDAYVGASKKLNAATNPYDDENIKGWADGALTDPALVEHVVNGYFGGVGSSVNRLSQLVKHADEMSPTEAITSNWMPIVRTQHYSPNERTRYARTRSKWWYYKEEADKTQEVIKALKKRGEHNPLDYMQSISEEEGKKGARAKIMDKAYKRYSKVKKKMESTDDLQQMNIYQLQMDQIMEGAVKELDKIN